MTTAGAASPISSSTIDVDDDVDGQRAVKVFNCARLGLTANPPRFSFLDFFRRRR